MKPRALVLTGHGINGEQEMAQSLRQSGAEPEIVHLESLIRGDRNLDNYQILAFPGGFAYADDLGAGVAMANKIKNNIWDEVLRFIESDKLVFGICNGFQMMVNLGILPGLKNEMGQRQVALRHNNSNRYQCRWIHIKNSTNKCVWTQNIGVIPISIGHGEGNFYAEPETMEKLKTSDQIAFQYCDAEGNLADGVFPLNPNGAMNDIAGICDDSGRILGMMPHPDRFLTAYNEDLWTLHREQARRAGIEFSEVPLAQQIYQNGVNYFK